jgi:DNA-binding CsgD family transcriptional regulator
MRPELIDVCQATDVATLRRRLVAFAEDLGFGLANAVVLVEGQGQPMAAHYVGNMPASFAATSMDPALSRRDPVMRRLRDTCTPFSYDQSFYVEAGAGELWELMAPHGFRTGLSVAFHLPFKRHFVLGVDREQALPRDDEQRLRLMADLHLFAAYCQEAAVRLFDPEQSRPAVLSAKELEILKWTMEGKSKWEIGMILGLSENTIKYYAKRVQAKLAAPNLHAAVVKALRGGLL